VRRMRTAVASGLIVVSMAGMIDVADAAPRRKKARKNRRANANLTLPIIGYIPECSTGTTAECFQGIVNRAIDAFESLFGLPNQNVGPGRVRGNRARNRSRGRR
jgi:hypothetical protein